MQRTARTLFVALVTGTLVLVPAIASAADHLDGAAVKTNHAADINDVYVFDGADAANTVLTFDVNPAAGMISGTTFDPGIEYAINVDTDGDAVEDIVYSITFAAEAGGTQAYTVTKDGAAYAAGVTGTNGTIATGGFVFAGLVDDPFYFDLGSFNDFKASVLAGDPDPSGICSSDPDTNFFAGFNATAIVLEVPDTDFAGATGLGVWAVTRQGVGGAQIDRMGRPGINTVFVSTDADKDAFNLGAPSTDVADWSANVSGVTSAIRQAVGEDAAAADAYGDTLAGILLPDVLTYDTTMPAAYLNGRALADDVIDASYAVITDGAPTEVTTDCVPNDSTFQAGFPYYGVANAAAATPTPAMSMVPNTAAPEVPGGNAGLLGAGALVLLIGGLATLTLAEARRRSR